MFSISSNHCFAHMFCKKHANIFTSPNIFGATAARLSSFVIPWIYWRPVVAQLSTDECVLLFHIADAEWPEALLFHRMTSEESAQTCLERRKARQHRWEELLERAMAGNGPDDCTDSVRRFGPNPTLSAAAIGFDGDDSVHSMEEWQMARDVGGRFRSLGSGLAFGAGNDTPFQGRARDAAGLMEWKQQVLFRGMRVRMSVATGYVESVRVHTVTKRAEYTGDVLKKVQAVGEAPHGGQVRNTHMRQFIG